MIPPLEERLCAVRAAAAAQDPIGSGGTVTRLLFIETPTPWGENLYKADPRGTVRQRIRALQMGFFERLRATGEAERVFASGYPGLYGIAPDGEWSRPGEQRVLLATRQGDGPFAGFDLAEHLFPTDSPLLVDLARAFYDDPAGLERFAPYRTGRPPGRELFVCTHGHVDTCCARYGVPLYRQARAAAPDVRAWRTTHFGGHRFAPTAWELPGGHKWGFLDPQAAGAVLRRDGHPAALVGKLRGWSGVPAPVQLLDREGLVRHGWEWLDCPRAGEVLEADDEAGRWRVRLRYEVPGAPLRAGVYEGLVTVNRELPDNGCGRRYGELDHRSRELLLASFAESPATTAPATTTPAPTLPVAPAGAVALTSGAPAGSGGG